MRLDTQRALRGGPRRHRGPKFRSVFHTASDFRLTVGMVLLVLVCVATVLYFALR